MHDAHYTTDAIMYESAIDWTYEMLNFVTFLYFPVFQKLKIIYSLWYDPIGAQTHDLPHSKWAR